MQPCLFWHAEDVFGPLRTLGVGKSAAEFGAAITKEQIDVLRGPLLMPAEPKCAETSAESSPCPALRCGFCASQAADREPVSASGSRRVLGRQDPAMALRIVIQSCEFFA